MKFLILTIFLTVYETVKVNTYDGMEGLKKNITRNIQ